MADLASRPSNPSMSNGSDTIHDLDTRLPFLSLTLTPRFLLAVNNPGDTRFIAVPHSASVPDDDAAEGAGAGAGGSGAEPPSKRQRTDRKKTKGQNKNRPAPIAREAGPKICKAWEQGVCERQVCTFQHGWAGYFEAKPRDLVWPASVGVEAPYAKYPEAQPGVDAEAQAQADALGRTIDLGSKCPVYEDLGYCPYAWRCRFLGGHVRRVGNVDVRVPEAEEIAGKIEGEGEGEGKEPTRRDPKREGAWELTCDTTKDEGAGWKRGETNWPETALLQSLRQDKVSCAQGRGRERELERELEPGSPPNPPSLPPLPTNQPHPRSVPSTPHNQRIAVRIPLYPEIPVHRRAG